MNRTINYSQKCGHILRKNVWFADRSWGEQDYPVIGREVEQLDLDCLLRRAIRYYEKEGLIAPLQKSDAGYCLYNDDALRRLRFIKQARRCGFTLAEILRLLTLQKSDSSCCNDVRKLAVEKKPRHRGQA